MSRAIEEAVKMEEWRQLFEYEAGNMGFDLTRYSCPAPEPWSEYADAATGHRWAGWLAGRHAARAEALREAASKMDEEIHDITDHVSWLRAMADREGK